MAARTGIEEAVRAAGTGERGLAFVDGSGAVQAEFPVTSGDGAAGDGPTAELEILRGDLGQILFEHTADRVPYRFGDQITRLADSCHERFVPLCSLRSNATWLGRSPRSRTVPGITREVLCNRRVRRGGEPAPAVRGIMP